MRLGFRYQVFGVREWGEFFLKLARWGMMVFVFLFPFNVRSLVWSEGVFWGGNFNEFGASFLYLNDLVLVGALVSFLVGALVSGRRLRSGGAAGVWILGGLMLMMGVNFLAAVTGGSGLEMSYFLWLRWVGFGIFVFLGMQELVSVEELVRVFLASLVVQGLIGIFQYVGQGSVGLGVLGEPQIGPDVEGVAKFGVVGKSVVRAYGTFLHANVFGGAMLVGVMLGLWRVKDEPFLYVPFLVVLVVGLILSFSRSAWVGGAVAGMVWYALQEGRMKISFKYIFLALSLVLLLVVSLNLQGMIWERIFGDGLAASSERVLFFGISLGMLLAHPLGVGLGGFTSMAQDFAGVHLAPWLIQPVHNVYMLVANEVGIFGVLWVVGFLIWLFVKISKLNDSSVFSALVMGLMTVMLFDHYFWTIYAGQFLVAFVFVLLVTREGRGFGIRG